MKVIIADDEKKICSLIKHLADWESLSMEVIAFAHDGYESINLIRELKPDIVITDIRMPGFNGLEVIKEIKIKQPEIEFIVISGVKQFEYAKEALQYGVLNYLLKPINQKELMHTLEKVKKRHHKKSEQTYKNKRLEAFDKESQRRIRQEWFTNSISKNIVNDAISVDCINKQYHYNFQENLFRIAILKIDGIPSTELKSKHFDNKVEWQLHNHLKDYHDFEYIFYEGKYVILLNDSHNNQGIKTHLQNILEELLQEQDIFKSVSITIGLGIETYLQEISQGFKSANWALAQRLVRGTNQIITEIEYDYTADDEIINTFNKQFFHAIEMNDENLLKSLIANLQYQILMQENVTGVAIFQICKEVFNLYLLALKRFQFPFTALEEVPTVFFSEIENFGNGSSVFKYLNHTISSSFQQVLEEKTSQESKPISHAKKYITQNFTKPITLDMVSSEVGFSSAYFSTMFKNKTGENFSEYLFNMRMEEAKRQLRDTQYTVTTVCQNVGYLDIKHFTNGFKKYTGLKPKEYRKLYG